MVAVPQPLLSASPQAVPQRAGLGDRFHYFRGLSGRRYLFSKVAARDLGDFHSAVVMLARPTGDGRVAATWVSAVDEAGRVAERRWPAMTRDTIVLVHLLSRTDAERRDLVEDLVAVPLPLAA